MMQQVDSTVKNSSPSRPQKEKRVTYVLNDANDSKHCSSINCLSVLKSSVCNGGDYLFTGSRDSTVKRWKLSREEPLDCSTTFESHADWVNDVAIVGDNTLISCSSDATIKTWECMGEGSCSRTLRKHSDYVTCLATAEQKSNFVASGGLGGEVFVWDVEASPTPLAEDGSANVSDNNQPHDDIPKSTREYKKSVYALAMNASATLVVSSGTDKVVRVWDPRSDSKAMKLRGHSDNIRALLLDSTGRFCLSGSSDSMIRLWDIGQQRCVHSYAVHTDSVWALASTPAFSHAYSGGRDMSVYLTDLTNKNSLLLCRKEHPIQQLALQQDDIWIASTASSIEKWPAEVSNPNKLFENGGSFLTGSFSREMGSLDEPYPDPVYKEPICTILGAPAIVEYEVLNTKRHVVTKDNVGSVKLWEITRGVMVEDYGKVSFEDKTEELHMTVTVPAWFTVDARLGCLSINLDMPQCFSAEARIIDHNAVEDEVNLGQETLKSLFVHWLTRRTQRVESETSTNTDPLSGTDISSTTPDSKLEYMSSTVEDDIVVHSAFDFSKACISIITEGSNGGLWRKRITDLDGTEDEKDFPWWCVDCVVNNSIPSKENNIDKPREGSSLQIRTPGKLSAPRVLRFPKQSDVEDDSIRSGQRLRLRSCTIIGKVLCSLLFSKLLYIILYNYIY